MEEKTIFAQNLRKFLNEKGIKKKELADKVGVKAPVVSNWLGSNYYPRPKTLQSIADALGVTVDELTGESKDETAQQLAESQEAVEYWRKRALEAESRVEQLQGRPNVTPAGVIKLKEALMVIVDVVAELVDEKKNA